MGILFLLYIFILIKIKTIQTVSLLISVPGYFLILLVFLKFINFSETSLYVGVLPIWMIVLWPSFSILFDEILIS